MQNILQYIKFIHPKVYFNHIEMRKTALATGTGIFLV